jgi:hypothetical protein
MSPVASSPKSSLHVNGVWMGALSADSIAATPAAGGSDSDWRGHGMVSRGTPAGRDKPFHHSRRASLPLLELSTECLNLCQSRRPSLPQLSVAEASVGTSVLHGGRRSSLPQLPEPTTWRFSASTHHDPSARHLQRR